MAHVMILSGEDLEMNLNIIKAKNGLSIIDNKSITYRVIIYCADASKYMDLKEYYKDIVD